MPDKKDFGYAFPCDGPGRGGTCDISAWDSFYLAMFWMLNTIAWVTFYWHWKNLSVWQDNLAEFNQSSTYLMGWLRDYLWVNSGPLITGYTLMELVTYLFGLGCSYLDTWFGQLVLCSLSLGVVTGKS